MSRRFPEFREIADSRLAVTDSRHIKALECFHHEALI